MSNYIVGLAGICEKLWTLEREKTNENSFCSNLQALKNLGEKFELVTSINSMSLNEARMLHLRLFWNLADKVPASFSSKKKMKVACLDLTHPSLKLL